MDSTRQEPLIWSDDGKKVLCYCSSCSGRFVHPKTKKQHDKTRPRNPNPRPQAPLQHSQGHSSVGFQQDTSSGSRSQVTTEDETYDDQRMASPVPVSPRLHEADQATFPLDGHRDLDLPMLERDQHRPFSPLHSADDRTPSHPGDFVLEPPEDLGESLFPFENSRSRSMSPVDDGSYTNDDDQQVLGTPDTHILHPPPPLSNTSPACFVPIPPQSNNATTSPLLFDDVDVAAITNSVPTSVEREELRIAMEYIPLLKEATLEDTGLSPEDIENLRNPSTEPVDLEDDFDTKLSLDLYLSLQTYPDAAYTTVVNILNKALPNRSLLSHYRVRRRAQQLSGVATIEHDMCPNSCIAYTGPLAEKEKCYECGQSRWDPKYPDKKVPAAKFTTMTLGTQLQALYASPESAKLMRYRREKTKPLLDQIRRGEEVRFDVYDDLFTSHDYLDLVKSNIVNDDSILLMLSTDGAQLYRDKASDCWMIIWVILELSPDRRYKKRHVIPAGFIPGPGKPKNLDTFLFPSLQHISALQREGLKVWDASINQIVTKTIINWLDTADAPGMADMSGIVGSFALLSPPSATLRRNASRL
ncbi:hypothetical protein NP233_g11135 [Leucocoprinus birnbaumii]|uniref:Uncharacterized protein n=1 Tax=Leucocoprinus birnbaumii TaxID=56174 RepID=A0AAD5VHF2_9AGAR|nr:hypothetical protein NP233_g11135 [Leucocoprinus birnbaumii]